MQAVIRSLRQLRPSLFQPPLSPAPLERAFWFGAHNLYTSRSGGSSSGSDEEGAFGTSSSSSDDDEPGPSGYEGDFERERRAKNAAAELQAMSILSAALDEADEEGEGIGEEDRVPVREEDQMSLRVGVVGSPNAGKSKLTNRLVSIHIIFHIFALMSSHFPLLSLWRGQYAANHMVHNS